MMTFAEMEAKIRSGAYPSYVAACTGISKMKSIDEPQRATLKRIASECISRRGNNTPDPPPPAKSSPVPLIYEPTQGLVPLTGHENEDWFKPLPPEKAAEAGLEPDETAEVLVLPAPEPHKYKDMRELRDALASELARIDAELAEGEQEEAQEEFREKLRSLFASVERDTIESWKQVKAAKPADLAKELSSGPLYISDVLRLLALLLVHDAPLERPAPAPAESAA